MNNVMLVGRLTNDIELKTLESGKNVSSIQLAVTRPFKNIDGTYDTDFIECVLWDELAENIREYCKKGDTVGVRGRLQTELYEDKEGKKRKSTQVIVEKLTFLTSSTSKTEEQEKSNNKKKKN